MQVLCDSSILIDHLRGFEEAQKIIINLKENKDIVYISTITEAEVLSGEECKKEGKKERILNLLLLFNKVDVDSEVAQKAAEFRRNYGVPLDDCIIAATAFQKNCRVWTKNIEEFRRIKDIVAEEPY